MKSARLLNARRAPRRRIFINARKLLFFYYLRDTGGLTPKIEREDKLSRNMRRTTYLLKYTSRTVRHILYLGRVINTTRPLYGCIMAIYAYTVNRGKLIYHMYVVNYLSDFCRAWRNAGNLLARGWNFFAGTKKRKPALRNPIHV